MRYLMELILSTAKGCRSTSLFQNNSIIFSRCSGYWKITHCWFCKQFTVQALSSDISSSEWNKWHHKRHAQGKRTSPSTFDVLFNIYSSSVSAATETGNAPEKAIWRSKINAYESLGFYPCSKGDLPEVWKLLLNWLSMKVPVLSLSGQTGFKAQLLSLNTLDS